MNTSKRSGFNFVFKDFILVLVYYCIISRNWKKAIENITSQPSLYVWYLYPNKTLVTLREPTNK